MNPTIHDLSEIEGRKRKEQEAYRRHIAEAFNLFLSNVFVIGILSLIAFGPIALFLFESASDRFLYNVLLQGALVVVIGSGTLAWFRSDKSSGLVWKWLSILIIIEAIIGTILMLLTDFF